MGEWQRRNGTIERKKSSQSSEGLGGVIGGERCPPEGTGRENI